MPDPLLSPASSAGFTLIELLAVLAISAILLALGVPAFSHQRAESAVRVAANRTVAALHLARQQALATGRSVTVCPSFDGRRCGFGASGWMLFENAAGGSDSTRDPGDRLLQVWTLPERITAGGTRGYAAYQPQASSATTLTFEFCYSGRPSVHRSVIVSQTGRVRISRPDPASSSMQTACR